MMMLCSFHFDVCFDIIFNSIIDTIKNRNTHSINFALHACINIRLQKAIMLMSYVHKMFSQVSHQVSIKKIKKVYMAASNINLD